MKLKSFSISLTAIVAASAFLSATAADDPQEPQTITMYDKLGFGVGLSLTVDTGSTDRIDTATIVNNIVRADVESQTLARAMLETHYFFQPTVNFLGVVPKENWGWGPFVGIVPGEQEIITAATLGIMIGFKRDPNDSSKGSWNLGIGYVVDPKVKTLGDGITKNMPLPMGETVVRFKEQTQTGVGIVFSASF